MPSLFACLGCGGGAESDDIRVLDYRHAALTDVPSDVFATERTLEELRLDSNQLSELPRQLFYCHGLKELGLSDNELTSLPPAVASLINLTSIDLSKNSISDIPDNIKGCKQLSVVDASINPLCRLPEGFTQLLSLQELYLNDTFLEYLPANFGRLSRLRILELRENQLNTLPKSMGRLTNLQRLDIGQNDFSELPEVIGSLGNLTELWFDNNKVKSLPPLMGRLKKLVHVDASKNKVDWVSEELQHCSQLTDLHLSSNNLKELPEKLGECRQLQILRLDDNALAHLPESMGGLVSLEELVVTQNDLESLPASIGLLRALRTLHVDDNLLAELPPELGSCARLTVLTAASNRLTSIPAELGHLQQLVVLNICDNMIHHLPVSLTKLRLRALWLSENQNKPRIQLQCETLSGTGERVLTCFMLPQQPRSYQPETVVETDTFPGQGWDEQRKAKTLIKFAFDGDVDKPGRLTRAPTPYPKELKALAKHARNLSSLQKDSSKQFVLGRSQDNNKVSSSTVVSPSKDDVDADSSAKEVKNEIKSPLLTSGAKLSSQDVPKETDDNSLPLTVVEPQLEERPLLREARNVRNTPLSNTPSGMNGDVGDVKSINKSPSTPERSYAIGDRKVFGHAQVVAVNQSVEKQLNEVSKSPSTNLESNNTESSTAPSSQHPSSVASSPEGEPINDSPDKRIKKPPPYHIAAVMSRHAADFQEPCGEVSSSPTKAGLTVKDLPSKQDVTSVGVKTVMDEENVDTSSSSDSGYGNGKSNSQQNQRNSVAPNSNSPTSPQNTDTSFTMPSTPSSPLSPSSPGPVPDAKSAGVVSSPYSGTSSLSNRFSPTSVMQAGNRHSHAGIQQATVSSTPSMYSSQQLYSSHMSGYPKPYSLNADMKIPGYSNPPSYARPASIATGPQLERPVADVSQRPGSLALGPLADSALLNRLPRDQRPGSLAAPINTIGIPPAPARAMSYMGINVTSPTKHRDPAIFRSQDILGSNNGEKTYDQRAVGRAGGQRQESNGLVSIIDQVTTGLLEHGESPPLKSVDTSSVSSTLPVVTAVSSSISYSKSQITQAESSGSRGLTNFTQDQPRGEVLHPTPHRPHMISSSVQESTVASDSVVEPYANQSKEPTNVQSTKPEHYSSPPKPAPKPVSKIPSLTSEPQSNHNNSYESHIPSHSSNLGESRIPSLGSKNRSTSILQSNAHSPLENRMSPLSQETKGLESQIPSYSFQSKQSSVESRIPMYGSNVRNTDCSSNNSQISQGTQKPLLSNMGRSSSNLSNDAHSLSESRIPTIGGMVRSSSNLARENLSSSTSSGKLPTPGLSIAKNAPTSANVVSSINSSPAASTTPTVIPTLASQGRSNSVLGSGIPAPGSTCGRSETPKNQVIEPQLRKPLYGIAGQTSGLSRLQSPGYSSGIRPPGGMHTNSPVASTGKFHDTSPLPSPSQIQSPGYRSGIKPLTVNAAINTPGIPLPPTTPTGHYNNPGSRSSVSSTGSGSRIPMTSGLGGSKLPTLSATKNRMTSGHSADGMKSNSSSAWMFGQHKNAHVTYLDSD
ncbi:hypothetical protein SK128_009244 [Halocaridina rubra]|uniref:Disease resistance R13L4/SHOC-2-like LRR domain-containing protein n=1 Tax=Halocaridina rubra TaxID=373956 RepID=A0AAN9AC78_HALRR